MKLTEDLHGLLSSKHDKKIIVSSSCRGSDVVVNPRLSSNNLHASDLVVQSRHKLCICA